MATEVNEDIFQELNKIACKYIAGGVVSLNRKVEPNIIFKKGKGCKIYDLNDKEYIDYHAAFGPHMLGHNNEEINQSVIQAIKDNLSLIATGTNLLEIKLARLLCESIPSVELVQITNTGSEASAHAIRLCRAFTRKDHIVLIAGGYNGWHNDVARQVMPSLKKIGPRVLPGEYAFIPSSAGIPEAIKEKVHCINFNDLDSLEFVLNKYPVACVLLEPVLQNIGVVLPKPGYLQAVITLCDRYRSICIFDEVKTGFRSALGGYQSVENVSPHLSIFGKAIANGYPMGAIGGRRDIMELFDSPDPDQRVLIAGTYNAHPYNMAAALATIRFLQNPDVYKKMNRISDMLYDGLRMIFKEKGIPIVLSANASASCIYFTHKTPADLHDLLNHHDFEFDIKYRRALIEEGIYLIPLPCKQSSVSYAHEETDIEKTLTITRKIIQKI
jgi:glutamate-1-semialdehyde 2,1-aminomutase